MRFYGVDIGYGFTKVAAAGRPPLVMPSIVGSNEELSYRSDIGDRIRIIPLSLNGHSYLVGEAAKRFSRHRYRIFDSTWAESPYYLLLFVSALMRIDKGRLRARGRRHGPPCKPLHPGESETGSGPARPSPQRPHLIRGGFGQSRKDQSHSPAVRLLLRSDSKRRRETERS